MLEVYSPRSVIKESYKQDLIGKGILVKENSKFFTVESSILDAQGNLLANGTIKYIKLDVNKINDNISAHEEMCYLIDDGVTDI